MYTFNVVQNLLQSNVIQVKFNRVDGQERVMTCTLKKKYLPEAYQQSSGAVLTEGDGSAEAISVWDVNANGWRSFRINSIKELNIV